jgi:hypothetical protein
MKKAKPEVVNNVAPGIKVCQSLLQKGEQYSWLTPPL